MPRWRSFFILINLKTVVVAGLSIASTFACRHYGIFAEFPLTLIAIAVVFPIVFSIGGAYKRREAALDDYASMKEAREGIGIYIDFFNDERPHSALGSQTPAELYDGMREKAA